MSGGPRGLRPFKSNGPKRSGSVLGRPQPPNSRNKAAELVEAKQRVEALEMENKSLKQKLKALRSAQAPMTKVIRAATQFSQVKKRPEPVKLPDISRPSTPHTPKPDPRLKSMEDELARLRARIKEQSEEIDSLKKENLAQNDIIVQLTSQTERLTNKNNELSTKNTTLQKDKVDLEALIAKLRKQLEMAEFKIDSLKEDIAKRIDRAKDASADINRLTATVRDFQDSLMRQAKDQQDNSLLLHKLKEAERVRDTTIEMGRKAELNLLETLKRCDVYANKVDALEEENQRLKDQLSAHQRKNAQAVAEQQAMILQAFQDQQKLVNDELAMLRMKASEMAKLAERQARDMDSKWSSREQQFRELWESREKEFTKILDKLKNSKVQVKRTVSYVKQDGSKSRNQRDAGQETFDKDISEFPGLMEEMENAMKGWSPSPASRLNLK